MSKRSEDFALKKWPVLISHRNDINSSHRLACIQGYEQAEKDTIERAARWIMKSENQAKARFRITDDEFIKLFRKEMED